MPPRPVVVSRRAVVGAALLATAGCSLDALDPSPDDPTFTPSSTPTGPGSGAPTASGTPPLDEGAVDADADLVDSLVAAISSTARTVRATGRRHPGLAGALAPLLALHRAHARELGGLVTARGAVADVGETPEQARARVSAAEARLQRILVRGAVDADSGALAQLLATMAAGLAQHRSIL